MSDVAHTAQDNVQTTDDIVVKHTFVFTEGHRITPEGIWLYINGQPHFVPRSGMEYIVQQIDALR